MEEFQSKSKRSSIYTRDKISDRRDTERIYKVGYRQNSEYEVTSGRSMDHEDTGLNCWGKRTSLQSEIKRLKR